MAWFRDDSGKTEKPTPERLGEARDKGQTPISREFTMAGSLLVAVLVIEYLGPWLWEACTQLLRWGMQVHLARARLQDGEPMAFLGVLQQAMSSLAVPFLTLVLIFVAATAVAGYGQIGVKLSRKALGFKPERLNPAANLGRLLRVGSVVRTLLSALKILVLGSVLWFVLRNRWQDLAALQQVESLAVSGGIIFDLAMSVFFWIAMIVLVLAVADLFWQRHEHQKNLMMTKQEVEDERKRNDGDPFIKNRLKNARFALMKHRMMQALPKADVVITNPTHYAVALAYDRSRNTAPEVVAKGAGDLALRIREVAAEHKVPIMEDHPLARALFRAVPVGREVPEAFYKAVATVLGHVYRMREQVA